MHTGLAKLYRLLEAQISVYSHLQRQKTHTYICNNTIIITLKNVQYTVG